MRYVGGKTRIASWVSDQISTVRGDRSTYIEPFLGSGASLSANASMFSDIEAGDSHVDLMMMWTALVGGWVPPDYVTKEEYESLRRAEPSALRGFVGFGSSWSGKWFGGYVHTAFDKHHQRNTKPYLMAAKKSVMDLLPVMKRANLRCCSFYDWSPPDPERTLIYCDPPYSGTLGYGGLRERFDTDSFWDWASSRSLEGCVTVVSEAQAPDGWVILAERKRKAFLRTVEGVENEERMERLFIHESRHLPLGAVRDYRNRILDNQP